MLLSLKGWVVLMGSCGDAWHCWCVFEQSGWYQLLCFLHPHTFTADDMVSGASFCHPLVAEGPGPVGWCCLRCLALCSAPQKQNKSMSRLPCHTRRRGSLLACTASLCGCCSYSCCILHAFAMAGLLVPKTVFSISVLAGLCMCSAALSCMCVRHEVLCWLQGI